MVLWINKDSIDGGERKFALKLRESSKDREAKPTY